MLMFYNYYPLFLKYQSKVVMNDLALLQNLFGNSEETKLLIYTGIFCLVFTALAKLRVKLRAKIGLYGNRCFELSFY